ncbi:MAG: RHS repeat-associated core domain-containing protein, partial [Candidatus Omnitrophica bacterium]|nr:RHS repeat-associated core domain-containing protein [Candidatus Omnitrophota bacterium]
FSHYIANPKFNQFDTLEYGRGYEIFITHPLGIDLTLSNLTHPGKLLAVKQGWNFLGTPSETPIPFAEALNNLTVGMDYDFLTGWNNALNTYEYYPTLLNPSASYWLYAFQDNTWQIETNTNAYATYTYNGDGERVAKYTQGAETRFFHDGSNTLYETDAANNITASYTHTLFIDDLISERKLNQTEYRLNDHLGSLRKLTNSSQTITDSVTYDAFGSPLAPSPLSRFLFTGREIDPETSHYYYRARTYQPSLGRFMSKDPLGLGGGNNFYRYVKNNPINLIDPFGLIDDWKLNFLVESSLNKEFSNADVNKEFTEAERKQTAREARKEMTPSEFDELRDKKTPLSRKEDILRDINDRLRGKGVLPPDLQKKLDKIADPTNPRGK